MHNVFLSGASTFLRPLEKSDAPALARWFNDPEVRRGLASYRPVSLESEEQLLARFAQSDTDFVLGIGRCEDGALLGTTGLHHIDARNRHAMFGIVLGDTSAWGKGHGTEATRLMAGWAFDSLNLNRVWLQVFEDNLRAVRVYEKVGFSHEGVLRQHMWRDGQYCDCYLMAMVRADWKKKKAERRGA